MSNFDPGKSYMRKTSQNEPETLRKTMQKRRVVTSFLHFFKENFLV